MRTCTNCGTPVGDAVFFCLSCGNRQKCLAAVRPKAEFLPKNTLMEAYRLLRTPPHSTAAIGTAQFSSRSGKSLV